MAERTALAVDLGGTNLRVARVEASGRIEWVERERTPRGGEPEAVIEAITRMAAGRVGRPVAAGVAAPGPLDPERGIVHETPNLRGWRDFPLAERLAAALRLPVWVHNDANLAGLGEARCGAGRGFDPLVYLTVSTGVGGGIVKAGRVYDGATGLAGELGHVIVRAGGPACNFGHAGCLEGLASGTAIARQAEAIIEAGVPTRVRDFADRGTVTGLAVAKAAGAGDPVAREIFRAAGEALGLAIGGFINILDPARVVIGGGVSRSWHLFAVPMHAAVGSVVMSGDRRAVEIVPADLGDDAGLVGAGLYALDRAKESA